MYKNYIREWFYMKCPVCNAVNNVENEFCYQCGIRLIENDFEDVVSEIKLKIPQDKIILLDLNYTLIANSKEIRMMPLDEKIKNQEYEMELIDLIKDNYVILITASPYKRSLKFLEILKRKLALYLMSLIGTLEVSLLKLKSTGWRMKSYHNMV